MKDHSQYSRNKAKREPLVHVHQNPELCCKLLFHLVHREHRHTQAADCHPVRISHFKSYSPYLCVWEQNHTNLLMRSLRMFVEIKPQFSHFLWPDCFLVVDLLLKHLTRVLMQAFTPAVSFCHVPMPLNPTLSFFKTVLLSSFIMGKWNSQGFFFSITSTDLLNTSRNGSSTTCLVPMPEHPLHEKSLPHVQSKPPLLQIGAIFTYPITCYLRKGTNTLLAATCCQAAVGND